MLLFSEGLGLLARPQEPPAPALCDPAQLTQWLACLLLGVVNIEQTKFLQWQDLDDMLGFRTTRPLGRQRSSLRDQATRPVIDWLFRWNYRHAVHPGTAVAAPLASPSVATDPTVAPALALGVALTDLENAERVEGLVDVPDSPDLAEASPALTNSVATPNPTLQSLGQSLDFYLDPHTQHYTGEQAVLKGWCPSIRWADKLTNSDYIHSSAGQPLYFECTDNFDDLRSRFLPLVTRFMALFPEATADQAFTFIVDRGISSAELFETIAQHPRVHLVTWEKDFVPPPLWSDELTEGRTTITKYRNAHDDVRTYEFAWRTEPWPKNPKLRRIVVAATAPSTLLAGSEGTRPVLIKGKTIILAVLTTDLTRPAAEVVTSIFTRWVQENDFKYLNKHFGINQITSYRSVSYASLAGELTDRLVPNQLWVELTKTIRKLEAKCGRLLYNERQAAEKEAARQVRLQELEIQIKALETSQQADSAIDASDTMPASADEAPVTTAPSPMDRQTLRREQSRQQGATKRWAKTQQTRQAKLEAIRREVASTQAKRAELDTEVSRVDQLIAQGKVRLDLAPKSLLDSLRVIARNLFYREIEYFKVAYDNFRDDHDHFRQLTQSGGVMSWNATAQELEIHLMPRAQYQPKLRRLLEATLAHYNMRELTLPDGSGRRLKFYLRQWSDFEIRLAPRD